MILENKLEKSRENSFQGRNFAKGEGERIFVEKVELRFVLVARFMDHVASNITRLYGILKVSPWIIIVFIRANNACNARVAGFARLILIVIIFQSEMIYLERQIIA